MIPQSSLASVDMGKTVPFRPIIFVSHSARNDAAAYPTLKAIEAHLKKNGFDVLLDETRIQGGEEWRNCLHTWMGHCHGAVLLLTPKALLSPWVLKEATILSWRQSLSGGTFPLLPVFLGMSAHDLAKSGQFDPLALTEIQALKNLEGLPLAKALAARFSPLRLTNADTPLRELENKVANLLVQVKKSALLEKVAENLGQDLGGWKPNRDLSGKVALLLLQAPLNKLATALNPLVGAVPTESLRSIVDMLRGSWVDRETAGMLTLVARRPERTRAAALNATEQDFTAPAVIARATGRFPPWVFIRLSSASGEDAGGSLKAQVRAALENLVGSKNPAIIEAFLQKKELREPAVIVTPPPETSGLLPDDHEIDELLQEFPLCTLLLLTGPSLPQPGLLTKVHRLSPPLEPNEEIQAYALFRDLELSTLTQR